MALCSELQFFLKLYLHTHSCMSCSRRQSSPVHTVRAELAVGTVPARRLQANRKLGGPAGVFLSPPAADPVPTARTRRERCLPGGARVCRAHGDAQGLRASASGPRARAGSDPSRHISEQRQEPGAAGRADPASRLTYSSAITVKQCLTCVNDWAIDSQNNQTNFSLTTDSNQFFPPCMFLRRTCD